MTRAFTVPISNTPLQGQNTMTQTPTPTTSISATLYAAADLLALADRCESATGADRELDYAIAFAVIPHLHRIECSADVLKSMGNPKYDVFHCVFDDTVSRYIYGALEYTASLDAAVTLIPNSFTWSASSSRHVPHNAEVHLAWAHGGYTGHSDHSRALSICAAALRAKAAS